MKTRIYAMTHRKFFEPEDTSLYIPLHVGRVSGPELGYLGDHTGENISAQNDLYGELTGVYWVWKNDRDSDVIGICHYRRYFVNENRRQLKAADYERILSGYDIIVSTRMQAKTSYLQYYGEAHNADDLYAVSRAIQKLYPKDYPLYEQILNQPGYYYGNLMVTSRRLFFEYALWLFSILEEAGKEIDVSSYDLYNRRVYGFLSEQLLMLWIVKKQLKAYECPIGITAEKAETAELKLAITQLIKQREILQARELFYGFLKIRPDVRLELSDIRGEIPVIEQLLYMMEEEKKYGTEGLLPYTDQLDLLIAHYKKVKLILKECEKGQIAPEDQRYFLEKKVSWVMVMVILLNSQEEIKNKPGVLNRIKQFYLQNGKLQDAKALEGVHLS